MRVCILGWYGTETLGDRAILDGIISIFSEISGNLEISISSLYPILTNRTISEDCDLFFSHCNSLNVSCFDAREKEKLKSEIRKANLVIFGGGPIMDLMGLYIISFAFRYAKKKGIKTAIVGCGYGPVRRQEFMPVIKSILKNSDLIIMRSEQCYLEISRILPTNRKPIASFSIDPAVISAVEYRTAKDNLRIGSSGYFLMNIRDLDYVYRKNNYYFEKELRLVENVLNQVDSLLLVPMHTFFAGGDDRSIQSQIAYEINNEKLNAIQKPLSLSEMYDLCILAKGCIGMRYHSVVFQSYLNGNNYIIDYTDKKKGKIKAFLDFCDPNGFFDSRYYHIDDDSLEVSIFETGNRFSYNVKDVIEEKKKYVELLSTIL